MLQRERKDGATMDNIDNEDSIGINLIHMEIDHVGYAVKDIKKAKMAFKGIRR